MPLDVGQQHNSLRLHGKGCGYKDDLPYAGRGLQAVFLGAGRGNFGLPRSAIAFRRWCALIEVNSGDNNHDAGCGIWISHIMNAWSGLAIVLHLMAATKLTQVKARICIFDPMRPT